MLLAFQAYSQHWLGFLSWFVFLFFSFVLFIIILVGLFYLIFKFYLISLYFIPRLVSLPLKSGVQIPNCALGPRFNMFFNEGTSPVLNELLSARSRLGLGCDPSEMPSVSKEAGLCWKLGGLYVSSVCFVC